MDDQDSADSDRAGDAATTQEYRRRHPLPSLWDWVLLAINTVFVTIGLFALRSEPDVGIVTLALFGSALAVTVHGIWRKFRVRRLQGVRVAVVGGVPIRVGLILPIGIGIWLIVMGGLMAGFGVNYGIVFRVLSAGIALAGVVALTLVALGRFSGRFLQFDPEGLTVGERGWQVLVPWDSIQGVAEASHHDNPMLLLQVTDPSALKITPEAAFRTAMVRMTRNTGWTGAPITIMAAQFSIDAPVLAGAITTYVNDHGARAQLRPALPGPG